ncbi:MAG: hypothetical protein PHX57_06645 [Desulfobulbaceae bacterium]|nr:hypothetical protein [Desulfobulbaceae bacterium]
MVKVILLIILFCVSPARVCGSDKIDPDSLIRKMEAAYDKLIDYQANLEIRQYVDDGSLEEKKLRYTYKKPGAIRLDFERPHAGMAVVYPDREGKVAIRPLRWLPFFILRKDLRDPGTQVSRGQQINQTDLGLLIRNIGHSVKEGRKGPVSVSLQENQVIITVLAENHFRRNITTRYSFFIDTTLWLPEMVEECDFEGRQERVIVFHDLKVNLGIADPFFHLD